MPETSYVCYYMCYNSYPVWPRHIPYDFSEAGQEIRSLLVTTKSEAESEDDFTQTLNLITALIMLLVV